MKKNCFSANTSVQEYVRKFQYNNIDVLTLSIKYPIISMNNNKRAEWLINNQITMNVDNYMKYAAYLYDQAVKFYHDSQENNFPFHSYEAYMEYTLTYNSNCFLSLYVDKYEFTGGAHGSTVRSSDTWNLCSGISLPISNYFEPGTNYRLMLTEEITRQAEYNLQQNPGIYFEDYQGLIIKNFNQNSYYLTPLGLTIYYQQYDIAPYSTGIVEFTIPYSKIGWYPRCSNKK